MDFYFAPMEGITGYIYRNAHNEFFGGGISKYFAPFISANSSGSFKTKEMNDVLVEHNQGIRLIPQILTNNADDFILTAKKLKVLGYDEINLNLGCPSGTVVSKFRGAGFLARPEELDSFLDKIYSGTDIKISVKTRIGKDSAEEFAGLLDIYNKYPMEELIIHPRIQLDYYKNIPNLDVYRYAENISVNRLCYNGDVFTLTEYLKLVEEFPKTDRIMIGRGLLSNPALVRSICFGENLEKETFRAFHDRVLQQYCSVISGDRNVLFKMKELWFYMIVMFEESDKYMKKIRKSERITEYEAAVTALFRDCDLISNDEAFSYKK